MSRWKIVKIALSAITALVTAAKSIMSFIDQIVKLRREPAISKT